WFLEGLADRDLEFVVEVRPSTRVRRSESVNGSRHAAAELLRNPRWRAFDLSVPGAAGPIEYRAAQLADVRLPGGDGGRLVAAQTGGILGIHRGTIFALSSDKRADLVDLLRVVGWARWIRPATRKQERTTLRSAPLPREIRTTGRLRLVFSGEVNPIFVETLRTNHQALEDQDGARVPERVDALDLRTPEALAAVRRSVRQAGDLHILIGGPPCQGFSNANRNSWHS